MFKFFDYFKKNKTLFFVMSIFLFVFISVIVALNNTYAIKTHTVIFNRYEDTEVMVTCETDVNGKLNADCITQISDICGRWSLNSMHDGAQTNRINSSEFANMIFTEDKEYYCVAGTSGSYNMGCYVCKADSNIMHWASSSSATTECPGGYSKSKTITTEENCKVYACYECSSNTNIMKWHYNGISDDTCPSGYVKNTKTQSECKPVVPNACYECKDNSNIMTWKNNDLADNNCPSGYVKNNKIQSECKTIIPNACYECKDNPNIMTWKNNDLADNNCPSGYVKNNNTQSECKTIIPNACYVCNDDSNILKWDNDGKADSKCSSGYYKSTSITTKKECVPIKNPPTGNIAMFLVWIIGLGCCVYSFYFFKKTLTD